MPGCSFSVLVAKDHITFSSIWGCF